MPTASLLMLSLFFTTSANTVVMIGLTDAGKSTLGNGLTATQAFKVGHTDQSTTIGYQLVAWGSWWVCDTEGFLGSDSQDAAQPALTNSVSCLVDKKVDSQIKAFILVVDSKKYYGEFSHWLKTMFDIVGSKGQKPTVIIHVTRCMSYACEDKKDAFSGKAWMTLREKAEVMVHIPSTRCQGAHTLDCIDWDRERAWYKKTIDALPTVSVSVHPDYKELIRLQDPNQKLKDYAKNDCNAVLTDKDSKLQGFLAKINAPCQCDCSVPDRAGCQQGCAIDLSTCKYMEQVKTGQHCRDCRCQAIKTGQKCQDCRCTKVCDDRILGVCISRSKSCDRCCEDVYGQSCDQCCHDVYGPQEKSDPKCVATKADELKACQGACEQGSDLAEKIYHACQESCSTGCERSHETHSREYANYQHNVDICEALLGMQSKPSHAEL